MFKHAYNTIKKKMNSVITVLMVAEKASIARSIAEAIAGKGKYVP